MLNVNFYLKDPDTSGSYTIYISVVYHKTRTRFTTKLKVAEKHWNERKQRVKSGYEVPNYDFINRELDRYEQAARDAVREMAFADPSSAELRKEVEKRTHKTYQPEQLKGFWDVYEAFVDYQRVEIQKRTVIDYDRSLRKHLSAIESREAAKLRLSSFDIQKEYQLTDAWNYYLRYEALNGEGEHGLSTNYVGKMNKCLRTFLNWCFERKYCDAYSLKTIPVYTEDTATVYLTEEELRMLEELSMTLQEQKQARDLFLLGCETGLRFSDFNRIHANMVTEQGGKRRLKGYHKKTKTPFQIPLSKRAEGILKSYDFNPPRFSSITRFNELLRQSCREAGITESIRQARRYGNQYQEQVIEKWELISSHTARRSFCTNKYLLGMPVQTLMKFSGHKTERAFMRYLKIDEVLAADTSEAYF